MVPDSTTSDYEFTGKDRPDRTGVMLVREASTLALEEMITDIETVLDLDLFPEGPGEEMTPPEFTLNIGFDTDVETTVNPADLPPTTAFKTHLLHTNHYGDRVNYQPVMAESGGPATLSTGMFTITVVDADESAETTYGRDRSPAPPQREDADYAARAFGPDHEVRLSDIDWTLNDEELEDVRQKLAA